MENQTAKLAGSREPRHNQLLSVIGQLSSIKCRLIDLKSSLGITHPEKEIATDSPTEIDPANLIDVMDRLPSMIRKEVDQINCSIDELSEALI